MAQQQRQQQQQVVLKFTCEKCHESFRVYCEYLPGFSLDWPQHRDVECPHCQHPALRTISGEIIEVVGQA